MLFEIDKGFWLGMGLVVLLSIVMNVVMWSLPPRTKKGNLDLENTDEQK